MFKSVYRRIRVAMYKRAGLQIADGVQLEGIPDFGTEPFLISIGPRVTIAADVRFINHDGATRVFRRDERYKKVIKYGRITIHENCFIGLGCILMPGVSIGPNSVVAAGSLVSKDVPPNTVVGGVPAKPITDLESYAAKALESTPAYDEAAYRQDKRRELLRIFPRPW